MSVHFSKIHLSNMPFKNSVLTSWSQVFIWKTNIIQKHKCMSNVAFGGDGTYVSIFLYSWPRHFRTDMSNLAAVFSFSSVSTLLLCLLSKMELVQFSCRVGPDIFVQICLTQQQFQFFLSQHIAAVFTVQNGTGSIYLYS